MAENSPSLDIGTLLAIDIGTVNTRAHLFDAVEGQYRFLAGGVAPTTAGAPMFDISEGVRYALDQLQRISGKILLENEQLVIPSTNNGVGVDHVAATFSAGQPLKVAGVGLLEDVSLESIKHLLNFSYAEMVTSVQLSDQSHIHRKIDEILRLRPDLIIIAGGTNGGASQAVIRQVNAVRMALSLLPESNRPEVLYAGNPAVADQVQSMLEDMVKPHITRNIRPDLNVENLGAAEKEMSDLFASIHARKILGIEELQIWSADTLQPTSDAFGRTIRFLSNKFAGSSILGVDLGASSTTIAAALNNELSLNVLPGLGMGEGIRGLLNEGSLKDVSQWLSAPLHNDELLNILYNKTLYPASIPQTVKDIDIEYAAAREILRLALAKSREQFPERFTYPNYSGANPWLDYIIVSGTSLTSAPGTGQGLITILDAIQPAGVSFLVMDKYSLLPSLGAAATQSPVIPVQVLESSALLPLGYVLAPVGKARVDAPVLQVRLKYDTGQSKTFEIKHGEIKTIPLPMGRYADMQLQPLQRTDIGWGPGKGGKYSKKVRGGLFGIIVDARGRPLTMSSSDEIRQKQNQKWRASIK